MAIKKSGLPKNLLSFILLVVLSFSALSYSMPAPIELESNHPLSLQHNTARQLWNNAKKAYNDHKRRLNTPRRRVRTRRESASNQNLDLDAATNSLAGPKHFVQLFKDLLTSPNNVRTQANKIRSLPFIPTVPMCGKYSFNLSAIERTSEYILKAELYLWLNINSPLQQSTYIVGVEPIYPDGSESTEEERRMRLMEVNVTGSDGYHMFDLTELLTKLVERGDRDVVFNVSIHNDVNEFKARDGYGCAENLKFAYDGFTDENMPILVAYSYDPNMEHINYQNIAAQLASQSQSPTPSSTNIQSVDAQKRKKRQTGDCGVKTLTVLSSEIILDEILNEPNAKVSYPLSYDAGICGGACDSSLPDGSVSNHAPLVSILIGLGTFGERHSDYTFKECCAPVRYESLRAYVNTSTTIVTLDNMKISECECLDHIE